MTNVKFNFYADDSIMQSAPLSLMSVIKELQTALRLFREIYSKIKLVLNADKTNIKCLSSLKRTHNGTCEIVTLNNKVNERVSLRGD